MKVLKSLESLKNIQDATLNISLKRFGIFKISQIQRSAPAGVPNIHDYHPAVVRSKHPVRGVARPELAASSDRRPLSDLQERPQPVYYFLRPPLRYEPVHHSLCTAIPYADGPGSVR